MPRGTRILCGYQEYIYQRKRAKWNDNNQILPFLLFPHPFFHCGPHELPAVLGRGKTQVIPALINIKGEYQGASFFRFQALGPDIFMSRRRFLGLFPADYYQFSRSNYLFHLLYYIVLIYRRFFRISLTRGPGSSAGAGRKSINCLWVFS